MRVNSELNALSGKIARLQAFLESDPTIDKQDILLLKAQLDIMKGYAEILIARLHYHNID